MKKLMFANTIYAQQEARKWMRMNSCKFLRLLIWTVLLMSQTIWGQSTVGVSTSQPPLQRFEGVWISDKYCQFSGLPFIVLKIHNGEAKLDMTGSGFADKLASNTPSGMSKEQSVTAQRIRNVDESSCEIVWSNERLKVPNQTIASGLGETGGDVAYGITKQGTSELLGDSYLGNLASDLASDIVSNIISSLIFSAFTPSKKINVMEMYIQQHNEYELTALAVTQEIEIKGENKPQITNNEYKIRFTKYDPASGVFFDIPFESKIYVPGDGLLSYIPKKYQKIGKSYLKYFDLRVPTHISQETISSQQTLTSNAYYLSEANPFNVFQIKKIQCYNEQRLLNLGYKHFVSKPYLGALMQVKEDKKGKKGCFVYQVPHSSPAYLFDIQEGDFILNIDGYDIATPEQAKRYIESLMPFQWVNIRLKRGKKTINVEVELSKQ